MGDDPTSEPTVEEIMAEVERRREQGEAERAQAPQRDSPGDRRLIIAADRLIFWLGRHWLAFFNLAALAYVGLSFLAPVLMRAGIERPAQVIYALYRPLCHQLPYRSWYLFGSRVAYSWEEMSQLVGPEGLVQHGYIGDPTLGYKVALCQRDTAIYGTILLFGLIYSLTPRRLKPMRLWAYVAFGIVPIGLDGGLQFLSHAIQYFSSRSPIPSLESTPVRRAITGTLFGLATAWLAYPTLQEAVSEILETLERRFGWRR